MTNKPSVVFGINYLTLSIILLSYFYHRPTTCSWDYLSSMPNCKRFQHVQHLFTPTQKNYCRNNGLSDQWHGTGATLWLEPPFSFSFLSLCFPVSHDKLVRFHHTSDILVIYLILSYQLRKILIKMTLNSVLLTHRVITTMHVKFPSSCGMVLCYDY